MTDNQFRPKQSSHEEEFERLTEEAPLLVRCECCGRLGSKHNLDRHHVQGRRGENMAKFVWLCRPCHQSIHADPAWAEELGLLLRNR